jgi:hypothetical protein
VSFFIVAPGKHLIESVPVTKPALGRSLGNLLEGSHRNASPEGNAAPGPDQLDLTSVTPGLGTLLRGSGAPRDELPLDAPSAESASNLFETRVPPSGDLPAKPQSQPEVHPTSAPVLTGLVQLSLLAADVVLLVLAWMMARAQAPIGFWMVLFCFGTVSLGAWLACLAVLLEPEKPEEPAGNSGRFLKK